MTMLLTTTSFHGVEPAGKEVQKCSPTFIQASMTKLLGSYKHILKKNSRPETNLIFLLKFRN